MGMVGIGNECYLYVNGLTVSKPIRLRDNVCLCPAQFIANWDEITELFKSDIDFATTVLSRQTIGAQLHITASDEKSSAISAWNAQWDCLLLGALFHGNVMCNLQSDQPVEKLAKAKYINVTNYAFCGLLSGMNALSEADEEWLKKHYEVAYGLLDDEQYQLAAHALASYMWHPFPRVQMAVIWYGIESLFNVKHKISRNISLGVANFLGKNKMDTRKLFQKVKKMYSLRSSAVHGNEIKDDIQSAVSEAANLLNQIIRHCAETKQLPNIAELILNTDCSLPCERGEVPRTTTN